MSENEERGAGAAPLSAAERAEQIRLAKERAAAARQAHDSDQGAVTAAVSQPANGTAGTTIATVQGTVTVPAAAAVRTATGPPAGPTERAEQVRLAKERALAARTVGGGAPVAAPSTAAPAVAAPAAAAAAPARERAEPASPVTRAAAIQAAKERAAAARTVGGATPVTAPVARPAAAQPAARAPADAEQRAAAVAQAQQRAAALKAQRSAPARTAAAPAVATTTWRVAPGGAAGQVATALPEAQFAAQAQTTPEARVVLRRRTFLRTGFWAGVGVLAAGSLATFADFFNPRDIKGFGGVVTVPASSVPKPGQDPYHYLEGKLWLVNLKPGEGVPPSFQSVAPPSKNGGLLALYQKCPHLGCTVPWRSDFVFQGVKGWFRCPCHGSTYAKGGVRVFGPAPRSMDTFLITKIDSSGVSVNTGKITLGALNDPQRVLPPGPFA